MPFIFSDQIALDSYWKTPSDALRERACQSIAGEAQGGHVRGVISALRLKKPADILVRSKEERNTNINGIRMHLASDSLPDESLVYGDGFFLVAPELCFLQMASRYSLDELALLGYRMCGDYRPSAVRWKEGDMPLTSVSKLHQYLQTCGPVRNVRKAMQATQWICDCSYSWMESRLALIIVLPRRLGGYSLPAPQLNAEIPGTTRKGDLCWFEQGVIVEYDSQEHHADDDALNRDAIRRMKIGARDYGVLTITKAMVMDDELLDEVMRVLAKRLGCGVPAMSPACLKTRRDLTRKLFHQFGKEV